MVRRMPGNRSSTTWLQRHATRSGRATKRSPGLGAKTRPSGGASRQYRATAEPTLLAVLASFHRSGYVREAAVDVLTGRDDALADKALTLRTMDWVDSFARSLGAPVLRRLDRRQALSIVPLLVAILGQDHSKGVLHEYLSRLDSETVRDLARLAPLATPRLVVNRGELPGEELMQLAIRDDDPVVRARAAALHDGSELVVRAAARLLRRRARRIPRNVIADAVASSSRATQLAGLRLARRSDGWSRLEADLKLAADADENVAREGREDLVSWVARVAPTLYGKPPPDQLDSIGVLLDRAELDEWLDREIRFHCGLAR